MTVSFGRSGRSGLRETAKSRSHFLLQRPLSPKAFFLLTCVGAMPEGSKGTDENVTYCLQSTSIMVPVSYLHSFVDLKRKFLFYSPRSLWVAEAFKIQTAATIGEVVAHIRSKNITGKNGKEEWKICSYARWNLGKRLISRKLRTVIHEVL